MTVDGVIVTPEERKGVQEHYEARLAVMDRYSDRQLQELKRQLEGERKLTEDEKKLLWSGIRHMKRKLEKGSVDVTLKTVIYHLGDLDVVTVPGELFSGFGLQIKAAMEAPMRIVWGYANYSAGYIVERDEYGKGYESMQTPFPQGEAELYVRQIIDDL